MGRLYIYLHECLIFYGQLVGKYTIVLWMLQGGPLLVLYGFMGPLEMAENKWLSLAFPGDISPTYNWILGPPCMGK